MNRKLRIVLILVLAAVLAVGSVAYAEPDADTASGEDSGDADDAQNHTHSYYWDPFSRSFRRFDLSAELRVLLDLQDAPNGYTEDNIDPAPEDGEDLLALDEEALLAAAQVLYGRVIGLDPGHQSVPDFGLELIAPDSHFTKIRQSAGCSGVRSGVPEYRVNLLVAEKVAALLQSCGATVVMSRTTNDVWLSNIERAVLMNQSGAALWIRLHCNACTDTERYGASVLMPSQIITPDIYEQSLYLSQCIGGAFGEATDAGEVQLVPLENQTGFNWSRIPVVALEMGYLTNAREDALLNSDAYQMRCALGIFNGIVRYFAGIAAAEEALDAPVDGQPVDEGEAIAPEDTTAPYEPAFGQDGE